MRPPDRTRVVHLVETLGRGGLERVVEGLATGLDPDRYEFRVCTLRGGGAVAERLRRRGIAVEALDFRPVLRPWTVNHLARRLTAWKTQVVHGHGMLAGALARLAGWRARVPCRVAHRHTTDEGERFRHRLLERILSRAGWTICCSEAVRARMVLEVGSDPVRTEVVYNGVPLERFHTRPAIPAGDPPILITVASLRPIKGHRVLLEAASRLAERGVDFRLKIVGDGPERENLERISLGLGLSGQISFLGERDDIPSLLSGADLFVLPTTGREGLGIAALEAMASGLPVVASRLGGLPELIRHDRTGLLVPPGDPGALEEAIREILSDPNRAATLGREGRERALSFSADAMVRKVEAIYRRDLEPSASRRTVLFLSSRGTSYGGGQAGLKMLATALETTRYHPLVVLPERGNLSAELSAAGVSTLLLPLPRLKSLRPDLVIRAVLRLRRLARVAHPQVVHVDGTRCALYALALPRRIRRLWHLRDVRPDPFDRWLAPHFDLLVAVCREVAVRRFPQVADKRVRVVPNAVPARRARVSREELRRRLGIAPGELVLLAAGRVERQKGTEELVRALSNLDGLGVRARVLMAGEAAQGEGERLLERARQLAVDDRLSLMGSRDDLPDLMRAADLLVHPSWYEAAPRVVLEAMASGLPVVATSVGGVKEILDDCGVLVPPRDSRRLAEAVMRLAGDSSTRMRLAASAVERYQLLYTPEKHIQAMAALYDELSRVDRARWEAA